MNLANQLTILRIVFIPVFIILLTYGYSLSAFVIFCLSGITDGVDGLVARVWGQQTRLGTFLDPLADKLLLTASFITLSALKILPLWLTVIVLSRDLIIMIGAMLIHMMTGTLQVSPSLLGKATTCAQILTIAFALLISYLHSNPTTILIGGLTWVTALLTVASGLHYIYRGTQWINDQQQLS